VDYNTENAQYRPTEYSKFVHYSNENIVEKLQEKIDEFKPDVIFWSAISSHIHGEGEYVNIQYGYELVNSISSDALKITAGLQPTAIGKDIFEVFSNVDIFIRGESEFVLLDIVQKLEKSKSINDVRGILYKDKSGDIIETPKQEIISNMDLIPYYDYSIFQKQIFWRPYNGSVIRAVDYELSRGCIYTCSYCVETTIQRYYGFNERGKRGALNNAKNYLRTKSAQRIYDELRILSEEYKVNLVRCQDTNFLTINRIVLNQLADLMEANPLDIKLYIETRAEGINEGAINLLNRLNVDGIGMGVELSSQLFREDYLHRFADQKRIIDAFKMLKKANIKRTAYNIIGLPDQSEESIKETIEFNQLISPDNVTVAFFSPYLGTDEEVKGRRMGYSDQYELEVDGQLRSVTSNSNITNDKLNYYKNNFAKLVNR
jgi:anaerobic magnesium-protoporphyrin IX monomethyl ester cyclase